ncbi:hypothetical protein M9H77_27996 [Catharanthus roseus]|uniref:Uncharacterized protein n=1 Tax=Catharanthus roseus TaxID=4058 RepID=A0ACC0AE38_CATRO|nr:hypothetical protein M9H77_27996 [Catharanthus roseus]
MYLLLDDPEFYEVKRKTDEEAAATSIAVRDDLAIIAIVAGGKRRRRVYGLDQKLMVEVTISSVSDAFDEYMRRFMEQNHLLYIPPLPMLDLVRAAMGIATSISLPPAPAADLEASAPDVAVQSFSTSPPSISAPSTYDPPSLV